MVLSLGLMVLEVQIINDQHVRGTGLECSYKLACVVYRERGIFVCAVQNTTARVLECVRSREFL